MKANVYRLPASLSTTGAALPCSFAFGAAQTPLYQPTGFPSKSKKTKRVMEASSNLQNLKN